MEAVFRKVVLLLAMLDEFPWDKDRLRERVARLFQDHTEQNGGLLALHNPYSAGVSIEHDLAELVAAGLVREQNQEWTLTSKGVDFLAKSGLLEFVTIQRKKAAAREAGHASRGNRSGDPWGFVGVDGHPAAHPLDR